MKGKESTGKNLEERVKYLEEMVATLVVSFFTLQSQLLDMWDEVYENKEESDNESKDESTMIDASMSHESLTEECVLSDTDTSETTKGKCQNEKDPRRTSNA